MTPEEMQMLAAMMGNDGTGVLRQELGAYKAMGPQGFAQHTGMGTLEQRGQLAQQNTQDQSAQVQQQMAMAEALRKPRDTGPRTNVASAILGGVGDIARDMGGMYMQHKLGQKGDALRAQGLAQQTAILDKMDAGRLNAGNARYGSMEQLLAEALRQQPQRQPAMPQQIPGMGLTQLHLDPSLFGG